MSDKDKAMQQALKLIERLNLRGFILADFETEVYATLDSLKTALEQQPVQEQQQVGPVEDMLLRRAVLRSAKIVSDGRFVTKQAALEQPPLPVQEPTQWRDMVVVSLVREGVNKHKARELADHFATQPLPVQEPVAMRMPKVGDKVICLEDESLGEVVSLTAGGSPDIAFADGSHGTYLLREFAELFGYVNSAQQQAEPVVWDKPSDSFNAWWDSDRSDNANPFATDSFSYWAWEGWQAALAQRQWVGLNDVDVKNLELTSATSSDVRNISAELKEKNT